MNIYGIEFKNIKTNSKEVKKGDIFVAIKGVHFDGHNFVKEAFERGAVLAIVEKINEGMDNGKIIKVDDTREELSKISAKFYGYPSDKMKVVGITGTNGKTTTCFLIDKILSDAGNKTGVVGTIYYKIGRKKIEADRTTPDALMLNNFLHDMAEGKTDYVVMEVSSHSLEQKRVKDVYFDAAVFMNITPEHLDYHKTIDSYFEAKAKIFDNLKESGCAVLNNDDPRSKFLKERIKKSVVTFGIENKADIMAKDIKTDMKGSEFIVSTPKGEYKIKTHIFGLHNVSNILAAYAVSYAFNLDLEKVRKSINKFKHVPGRMESIKCGQGFLIFVDFAHTEDALRKTLTSIKPYAKKRIISVFGCGGERDRTKRPRMGMLSAEIADYTIITSDNPRNESAEFIAKEIEEGVKQKTKNYEVILDREKAIERALDIAEKGDIILIAGKGHENTQIVGDKSFKFNDGDVVRKILKKKLKNK